MQDLGTFAGIPFKMNDQPLEGDGQLYGVQPVIIDLQMIRNDDGTFLVKAVNPSEEKILREYFSELMGVVSTDATIEEVDTWPDGNDVQHQLSDGIPT
jgi:hypothetical protein